MRPPASPAGSAATHARAPAERIAGFVAHLRLNGYPVGTAESIDALALAQCAGIAEQRRARAGLKVLLCANRGEWERFDELFDAYWFGRGVKRLRPANTDERRAATRKRPPIWNRVLPESNDEAGFDVAGAGHSEQDGDSAAPADARGRFVASTGENMRTTDLRRLVLREDVVEGERLAERIGRIVRYRLSRRRERASNGTRIDLRRTLRANLSKGGEPFRIERLRRPDRPANLVVLLDVSGSMREYSRFFLAFVRGVISRDTRADAFLFHTRLVRISEALRERDATKALDRLSLMAEGFGGGTRIGASLEAFNARYSKAAIDSRSIVFVVSDGYDTDEPERLAAALARLRKRARRLVWLNPLLGTDGYAPVARAMAAALPHIDLFAPAHDLASLEALESELERL